MKGKSQECTTNIEGCARPGGSMDSKLSMQNHISSGDAEKSQNILTSRGEPRSNYADNSLECVKACDVLIGNRERSTPH